MKRRICCAGLPRERGMTLIELLVVMAVLVILLGVAAPSFRDFIRAQRVKTAASELAAAMAYARSEAIKRRADVVVAAISSNFANGWEVRDAGGGVLRAQAALPDVTFGVTPSGTALFTYGLDGRTDPAVTDTRTALIYSEALSDRRCISVDTTGMPRARRTTTTSTTC